MSLDFAKEICTTLQREGKAYLVGGVVRDQIRLGLNFTRDVGQDIDVTTNLLPERVCQILSESDIHAIYDEAKNFGVVRAHKNHLEVEIATFRSDGEYRDGRHPENVRFVSTLEEDAKRRDFTCNAIYYDPIKENFADPTGGIADIQNRILRTVGESERRFREDYLRMIRYCRFRTKLGFKFSREIRNVIRENAANILHISPERIKMEMDKALILPYSNHFIGDLERTGLLHFILPELSELKSVDHPPEYHKEGGVYRHTLEALQSFSMPPYVMRVGKMLGDKAPSYTSNTKEEFLRAFFQTVGLEVVWGTLLHDVGKKPARKEEKGKVHFIGHEHDSVKISKPILERLRFSNKEEKIILWLIQNHLRPQYLVQMREAKRKATLREPWILQLFCVFLADAMGNYGADLKLFDDCFDLYLHAPQGEERAEQDKELKHLTDGKWLMEAFHLRPGKQIGVLKEAIHQLWLEGRIKTREDVLEEVKRELG